MSIWKRKKSDGVKIKVIPEREVDIEGQCVKSIDRSNGVTCFSFDDPIVDLYMYCTLDQHNGFVDRFRRKLGLPNTQSSSSK